MGLEKTIFSEMFCQGFWLALYGPCSSQFAHSFLKQLRTLAAEPPVFAKRSSLHSSIVSFSKLVRVVVFHWWCNTNMSHYQTICLDWLFILVTAFTGTSLSNILLNGLNSGAFTAEKMSTDSPERSASSNTKYTPHIFYQALISEKNLKRWVDTNLFVAIWFVFLDFLTSHLCDLKSFVIQVLREAAAIIPTQIAATWINWIIVRFTNTLPLFYLFQVNTFLFTILRVPCCARLMQGGWVYRWCLC